MTKLSHEIHSHLSNHPGLDARSLDYRVEMTTSCRDSDHIPKVADAGGLLISPEHGRLQIMHNGLKVKAGGYHGEWMEQIILRLQGHHEPQEEMVFHELLRRLPSNANMIEIGSFWAYYSLWFLKANPANRKAVCLEPDQTNLEIGVTNARINQLTPQFILGYAGDTDGQLVEFTLEAGTSVSRRGYTVEDLIKAGGLTHVDVLHCDAQGAELDVLKQCEEQIKQDKIRFIVISTHAYEITGDPLTHQRCLAYLKSQGAHIIAEHDVHESFSGDGLIVASFNAVDRNFTIALTLNRYSTSLFQSPAAHLASQIGLAAS